MNDLALHWAGAISPDLRLPRREAGAHVARDRLAPGGAAGAAAESLARYPVIGAYGAFLSYDELLTIPRAEPIRLASFIGVERTAAWLEHCWQNRPEAIPCAAALGQAPLAALEDVCAPGTNALRRMVGRRRPRSTSTRA